MTTEGSTNLVLFQHLLLGFLTLTTTFATSAAPDIAIAMMDVANDTASLLRLSAPTRICYTVKEVETLRSARKALLQHQALGLQHVELERLNWERLQELERKQHYEEFVKVRTVLGVDSA